MSFGIGVDLTADLTYFSESSFRRSTMPIRSTRERQKRCTCTTMAWSSKCALRCSLDLNTQVKKIVTDGEFSDMRHLLDSTRRTKAKIGFLISRIMSGKAEAFLFPVRFFFRFIRKFLVLLSFLLPGLPLLWLESKMGADAPYPHMR